LRQQRQQDDNRFRRLCEIAESWQRVELARAFIARLREVDLPQTQLIDGRILGEWLDWAEAKAAQMDPVGQGVELVFGDIARIKAWDYRS
jgi:hypothetical protein